MKFTPRAGIETGIPDPGYDLIEMKFTPLAGIETFWNIWFHRKMKMKFTPLAGIETEHLQYNLQFLSNEIHTPSGD